MIEKTLIDLCAERAMREEDYRIALKHRDEALGRPGGPGNMLAYERSVEWVAFCRDRMVEARNAVTAELKLRAHKLEALAVERNGYGDAREANELRQKARKLRSEA